MLIVSPFLFFVGLFLLGLLSHFLMGMRRLASRLSKLKHPDHLFAGTEDFCQLSEWQVPQNALADVTHFVCAVARMRSVAHTVAVGGTSLTWIGLAAGWRTYIAGSRL